MSWTGWIPRSLLILDGVGYAVALLLVPRILLDRRHPSATLAWFLSFLLLPILTVPLWFLIGERRVRRRIRAKIRASRAPRGRGAPLPPGFPPGEEGAACARVLVGSGAPPPVGGNRVRLLETGEEAWSCLEALVAGAREHVHAQFFILDTDDLGRRFVELLAERARAGVKVRLLLDDVGSWRALRGIVKPLRRAGGSVAAFLPALPIHRRGAAHLRNHRKLVVVDGAAAFTGGMNVGERYMAVPGTGARALWKDRAFLVEGAVVPDLQSLFLDDWAFATEETNLPGELYPPLGEKPPGEAFVQAAPSGPDRAERPIYQGVFAAIVTARKRVWVETPYFVPDDAIATALRGAALRGADVRLVVPAMSDLRAVTLAGRSYYDDMLRAGVRIFLYGGGGLHAKGLVADDHVAVAGTANVDMRSFFLNFELGIFLYDRPSVEALAAALEADMAGCAELDRKAFARRSLLVRLAEDGCRVFSPLF